MPILELQNVSKSFGQLKVTDDVSFDVPEGQALGIIGPNGAGKSTLFNLITGNLTSDTGKITFEGSGRDEGARDAAVFCGRWAVVSNPATLRQPYCFREPSGCRDAWPEHQPEGR